MYINIWTRSTWLLYIPTLQKKWLVTYLFLIFPSLLQSFLQTKALRSITDIHFIVLKHGNIIRYIYFLHYIVNNTRIGPLCFHFCISKHLVHARPMGDTLCMSAQWLSIVSPVSHPIVHLFCFLKRSVPVYQLLAQCSYGK